MYSSDQNGIDNNKYSVWFCFRIDWNKWSTYLNCKQSSQHSTVFRIELLCISKCTRSIRSAYLNIEHKTETFSVIELVAISNKYTQHPHMRRCNVNSVSIQYKLLEFSIKFTSDYGTDSWATIKYQISCQLFVILFSLVIRCTFAF